MTTLEAPLLSVVVPVADGWDDTFRLLMSLIEGTRGLPHEVIVVDDGSCDETAIALPQLPGLRLIRNEAPRGLVQAARQGAALARGTYLAFMGQGAVPRPSWPAPLLAALEGDPALGAAGPQLVDRDGASVAPNVAATWAAVRGLAFRDDHEPEAALALDGLVLRRAVFEAIGGLDESLADHGADVDLGLRLAAAGKPLTVLAESQVERLHPWGVRRPLTGADAAATDARLVARGLGAGPPPGARVVVVPREILSEAAERHMLPADVVLDVGCGIRPQRHVRPKVHVCCEPFEQYLLRVQADMAKITDRHWVFLKATWEEALERFPPRSVDTVFLLDIIEHLDKATSLRLLAATERLARKQVVVFTTLGFVAQHHPDGKDAWGLDGGTWQEHRSGWSPRDFGPGWDVFVAPDFHTHDNLSQRYEVPRGALYALRTIR